MRLSLRKQLLLLALVTLVLPWAGWRFVRGLEQHLRQGQAAALIDSADVLARVIATAHPALPRPGPLWFVSDGQTPIRLDGKADDWAALRGQATCFGDAGNTRLCVWLQRYGGALHVLAEVDDATPVHDPVEGDALRLLIDAGGVRAYRLLNRGGQLAIQAEDDQPLPTLIGAWQDRDNGYRIELRFAGGFLPRRMGIEALDRSSRSAAPQRIGNQPDRLDGLWPLAQRDPALSQQLARTMPPGLHARLLSLDGWVLADAGALAAAPVEPVSEWRRSLYDWFLGEAASTLPAAMPDRLQSDETRHAAETGSAASAWYAEPGLQLRLSAAAPVQLDGARVAVLSIERRSEAAQLSQRALSGLLGLSLLAMLAVGGVLLAYSSWLSVRIRRLGRAVDAAMNPGMQQDGHSRSAFQASTTADEIGDLSRRFGRLLDEVAGYTAYLKSLAGKLSHELHTPLAVVRSSLDNIEAQQLPQATQPYVERARDGATRLATIVRAMSEATRMEAAIAAADAESFDLRDLVSGCAEGYRPLLAPRRLELLLPQAAMPFIGAPELLAQALDKLIDNARDFCPADGWVAIALAADERVGQHGLEIAVANQGPPLNPEIRQRLFDSLVSHRDPAQRQSGTPHLGLGLHIVRLVAELHGGEVIARDLPNGDGVEFRLRMRGM